MSKLFCISVFSPEEFEKKKLENAETNITFEEMAKSKKSKRKVVRLQEDIDQCSQALIGQ